MILHYDVVDVPDVAAFAFVKVFAYRLKAFFFYVAFYVVVYIFIHNCNSPFTSGLLALLQWSSHQRD